MATPPAFVRGDRVRLKPDAPCPLSWLHKDVPDRQGIVIGVWEPDEIPDLGGHRYAVKSTGETYWQTSFTADELEKV